MENTLYARIQSFLYSCLLICSALSLTACGGGGDDNGGDSGDDGVDATAPSYSSSNTRFLNQDEPIVVVFSESIDLTNFSLSGSLIEQSDGGVWGQTNVIDDTFTLTPKTNWSIETNLTVVISVRDLSGNQTNNISYTFDVNNGTLFYVSSTATDDTGNGLTPTTAKKTVMAAIKAANSPATVLVNEGIYTVNDTDNSLVILKEGVSLIGGYNNDFTNRDTVNNVSTINNISAAVGSFETPNTTLRAGQDITASTRVDGFTINGSTHGNVAYSAAMLHELGASPTVNDNTLNGGSGFINSYAMINKSSSPSVKLSTLNGGSGGDETYAMYNSSSDPGVTNNTLNGGSGSRLSYAMSNNLNSNPNLEENILNGGSGGEKSYAMDNDLSSPIVTDNILNGGSGGTESYAMRNENSSPGVTENTLNGGSGSRLTYAMYNNNSNSSSFTVRNNTLNGGSGSSESYAMRNDNSSPNVTNNTINGGSGGNESYAMRNDNSSPEVSDNTLNGGSGGLASYAMRNQSSDIIVANNALNGGSGGTESYAMYNGLSEPRVINNTLNGGIGGSSSFAMYNFSSFPSVQNNTLNGGSGRSAYAMYNTDISQPIVENNLLLTRTGADSYCFYEADAGSDPAELRHNNFSGCEVLYFNFASLDRSVSIIDATEIDTTVQVTKGTVDTNADDEFASGNVGVDPMFADAANGDYHLTENTPVEITEGGLNGFDDIEFDTSSEEAKADKDGVTRPAAGTPWAIGAYEP